MHVIPPVPGEGLAAGGVGARFGFAPEPGVVGFGALGFFATVLIPFDVGLGSEEAGSFFAHIFGDEEWADVEADAVVEVGVPADGLFRERFPADENVVGGLAFEDFGKFCLEGLGGSEAFGGSRFVSLGIGFLVVDPVAEVGVGEFLERGVIELVVVHQDTEAVFAAVPNVPKEGTMVEELGVLLEKLIAQPVFDGGGFASGGAEQFLFIKAAKRGGEQGTEASSGGLLAVERGETDDAVVIRQCFQTIRAQRRAIGKTGAGLARPPVAEQPRHGYLQDSQTVAV